MLSESLQAYLAADTGLKGVLGTSRADKTSGIFPTIAPDACAMPYVVFQQVTGDGSMAETFEGTGKLQDSRWRFSCYGTSYKGAKLVAKYLSLAMFSFIGVQSTGAANVQGSWKRMEADDAEPIPHGTLFATHVDFAVIYRDNDTT